MANFKIKYKTPKCSKGEDVVYCDNYEFDDYAFYPLNEKGEKICMIWRTNIIEVFPSEFNSVEE